MKSSHYVLVAAGSNSGGQLGLGHLEDAHNFSICRTHDLQTFPPLGWRIGKLSSGANHTVCIIEQCHDGGKEALTRKPSREVWVCGQGEAGQLGEGIFHKNAAGPRTKFGRLDGQPSTLIQVSEAEAIDVCCGWQSTYLALRSSSPHQNDVLIVLGSENAFGELGIGQEEKASDGQACCTHELDLAGAVRAQDALDGPAQTPLRIHTIAAGLQHALLMCSTTDLPSNRERYFLVGWGMKRHGQLGPSSAMNSQQSSVQLSKGKSFQMVNHIAWEPFVIGSWTKPRTSTFTPARLAAGNRHSAILVPSDWKADVPSTQSLMSEGCTVRNGTLILTGSNAKGQLNMKDADVTKCQIHNIDCTWNGSYLLIEDDQSSFVLACGKNDNGQLGQGSTNLSIEKGVVVKVKIASNTQQEDKRTIRALVCGSEHACALVDSTDEEEILGWGWNEHGNLGQGDEEDRHQPVQLWPPRWKDKLSEGSFASARPTSIWAGCGTTFIQLKRADA